MVKKLKSQIWNQNYTDGREKKLSSQKKKSNEENNTSKWRIWRKEQRKRLTASNFGIICNELHAKCDTIVKKHFYRIFDNASLRWVAFMKKM